MSYLQINGYPIRVRVGQDLSYMDVAGHKGYSFNGRYQCSRNALGRRWAITSAVLPSDEVKALMGMLKMRGDAWRWDLPSGVTPNGVHYIVDSSDSEAYSDKRRVPQNTDAKATLASAYGADGSRVYDWNLNPYAPFSGCQGSLLVDGGTTNLLTANESNPESGALGWFASGGGAVAASTGDYWTGAGSVEFTYAAGTVDGARTSNRAVAATTTYVASVYIKGAAGGETITVGVGGDSSAITFTEYTLSSTPDRWHRLTHAHTTDGSDTTAFIVITGTATDPSGIVFIDGGQLEVDPGDGYPTAWVDVGSTPWGVGGFRPAGLLNFDQWMTGFMDGFTISAWVNLQYTGSSADRIICDTAGDRPRAYLYVQNSTDYPIFVVSNEANSDLAATGAALTTGWKHIVGVYSAKADTAYVYVNGVLSGSDAVWSANRVGPWAAAKQTGDFSIGTAGAAGVTTFTGPLGPIQFFPFTAPANFVKGLYASGADQLAVPGLMPLAAQGTMLGSSEEAVYCYAENIRFRMVPHKSPITGEFENGGGEVSFELVEATAK